MELMLPRKKKYFFILMASMLIYGYSSAFADPVVAPPHEIKGLYTTALLSPLWIMILALVALLLLSFIIFYFWKKHSRNTQVRGAIPATPQEIYAELKNFAPKKLSFAAYDEQKIYFLHLNHLMRSFIAGLSHLNVEALTSDELKVTKIPPKFVQQKKSWESMIQGFTRTEMVIFAGISLEFSEGENIYRDFLTFAKNVIEAEEAALKIQGKKDNADNAKQSDEARR